ncbi:MAG: helix-turn-helix domain-containing protein [Chloroflexus sp.]|nr:helix-turn-helix domain-containing protein [Chloroflexus sp.]
MISWHQRFREDQRQGRLVIERFRDRPRSGQPPQFTLAQAALITAVAWAQPAQLALPLRRFSPGEIALWIKQATWSRRSASATSGACCIRMPCGPGMTGVGLSRTPPLL